VTVALTGDGGDESFGGYGFRYVPHALEGGARGLLPFSAARHGARWLARRWPRSRKLPRALRLGSILDNLATDPASAYYTDLCFMKPPMARALLGLPANRALDENPVYADVTGPYKSCPSSSAVQRAQYADLKGYLPNDVLVKVDRMSMASGLEVRCPLLDRRVVELAFRIPTARKMPRLRAKHLLRQLSSRRLPAPLMKLPKRGFTAPVGEWMAGPFAERFASDVFSAHSATAHHLDAPLVRSMFDEHRQGRADYSYPLWAIWMLERWAAHRPAGSLCRASL
jgi:asparagine synthase (glutamine-hydrolysing)